MIVVHKELYRMIKGVSEHISLAIRDDHWKEEIQALNYLHKAIDLLDDLPYVIEMEQNSLEDIYYDLRLRKPDEVFHLPYGDTIHQYFANNKNNQDDIMIMRNNKLTRVICESKPADEQDESTGE